MTVSVLITGGLGNQLFQYAMATVLARGGCDVVLEPYFPSRNAYKREYALDFLPVRIPFISERRRLLMRNNWKAHLLRKVLRMREPLFIKDGDNWQQVLAPDFGKDAYLTGYWQSAEMVAQAKELLADLRNARDKLTPPPEMTDAQNTQSIAVHARRLWEHDAHGNPLRRLKKNYQPAVRISLQYYRRAFAEMRKTFNQPRFFIFGDDSQWCTEHLLPMAEGNGVVLPRGARADYKDMLLMARCGGCIASNSTFSWWAATIGGGVVIAPEKYHGGNPPQWKIISKDDSRDGAENDGGSEKYDKSSILPKANLINPPIHGLMHTQ